MAPRKTKPINLDLTVADELERRRLKEFFTVDDLIALGIVRGRTSLYRLIRRGEFPPGVFLSPRCKRWPRAHLEQWRERVLKAKHQWDPATRTAQPA